MRKGLKITVLIMAYFLLCARSCVDSTEDIAIREQKRLERSRDSIRVAFSSDYLPENSLVAYEASAIQKLHDFTDYLGFITDHAQGKEFRKKSAELARQLFSSGDVTIIMPVPGENSTREMDLDEVLRGQWAKNYLSSKLYIESIQVVQPLHRTGQGDYSGELTFLMTLKVSLEDDTVVSVPVKINQLILAIKESKVFGTDTLGVWETVLGDMRSP